MAFAFNSLEYQTEGLQMEENNMQRITQSSCVSKSAFLESVRIKTTLYELIEAVNEAISEHQHGLMHRLEMKGMEKNSTLEFIWSLKSCLLDNPNINHLQANERMRLLGWNVQLDCQTFKMAIACFEDGGYKSSENISDLV